MVKTNLKQLKAVENIQLNTDDTIVIKLNQSENIPIYLSRKKFSLRKAKFLRLRQPHSSKSLFRLLQTGLTKASSQSISQVIVCFILGLSYWRQLRLMSLYLSSELTLQKLIDSMIGLRPMIFLNLHLKMMKIKILFTVDVIL